jgi:predicted ATPase
MGLDVHRAARIAAAGHGGQSLLSDATRVVVERSLPPDVRLRDLGQHRLKDLSEREHLHQLVIDGLREDFPALRTEDRTLSNIAAPSTLLFGRNRELEDLTTILSSTRLVTLTGPGGTGKTRLATELGVRVSGTCPDGVFLVPLETFDERSPAAAEIGRIIGARLPGERDPEENLADHLSHRDLMLILDNLEQLTGVGPMVSRLLAAAPAVRIVATSRRPLHVTGEQEYPVLPLAVPGTPGVPLDGDLERIEAVALFVDRARLVRPDFDPTVADLEAVAAICRRLDGLPLAIELAAARAKIFSPTALLSRLDRALPLLGDGNVDAPARQRTLRAAIEWSCALLAEAERALFRRLTVFSGGWTLGAAEEVLDPSSDLEVDVLDGLMSLVDQSLIRAMADDTSGDARFDMLQLIREFGAERLAAAPEAEVVGRRHVLWALGLAEHAAVALEAGSDPTWLDRMTREHDNIRAALRWTTVNRETELGLRLATASWRFWQQRGHMQEGRAWFDRLMPAASEVGPVDPAVMAAAHTAVGGLAYWQGDLQAAEAHYESALRIDRELGRSDRLGNDIYNLGYIAMFQGDLAEARRRFDESAELFAAAGQIERMADSTLVRGAVEMRAGHLDEARRLVAEGRRQQQELGRTSRATDGAMVLSFIAVELGDLDAAQHWIDVVRQETTESGYLTRWPLLFDVGVALALKRARPLDALRLASGAARRRDVMGGSAPTFFVEIDTFVARARAAVVETVGEAAADAAWSEGAVLSDEALNSLMRT